jgi:hypothetical protein
MSTINNSIPFVPENTTDPAAGLNLSLNQIDALLQIRVQTVGANTPPAGVEGERHIVGTVPTGVWSGQANKLARYLDAAWSFYEARYAVAVDGSFYVRAASTWAVVSGSVAWGGITGTLTNQTDLQAALDAKLNLSARQTSATDTTVGALLTVGAFGLGATGNQINVTDANLATTTGFYSTSSPFTNSPTASPYYIITQSYDASRSQIATTAGGSTGLLYIRAFDGASWGAWRQIYHQGSILGTVSQTGGTPTGALMEYGTNANGAYWRYAGGMQVCTYSTGLITGDGGVKQELWNYPADFIEVPRIAVSWVLESNISYIVTAQGVGAISATLFAIPDTGATGRIHATLTGRWF